MQSELEKLIEESRWRICKQDVPWAFIQLEYFERPYLLKHEHIHKNGADITYWTGQHPELKPTHFRPLPDDRLAQACRVLLDAVNNVLSGDYPNPRQHRPGRCRHNAYYWEVCENCIDEYLQKEKLAAEAIAKGEDTQP